MAFPDQLVDCYISFNTDERLRNNLLLRDIVELADTHIMSLGQNYGAIPSLFYDRDPIYQNVPIHPNVCDAILRTRGGGLGVCLITREYFRNPKCVTEMRALLRMSEQDSKMRVMLVCVDCTREEIEQDGFVEYFQGNIGDRMPLRDTIVPHGTQSHHARPLNVSTVEAAAQDIALMIWGKWLSDDVGGAHVSGHALGARENVSFMRMIRVFGPNDISKLVTAFDMSVTTAPNEVVSLMMSAMYDHSRFSYRDLSRLRMAINMFPGPNSQRQLRAVKAFDHKWNWTRGLSWDRQPIVTMFEQAMDQLNQDGMEVGNLQ